MAWCPKCKMEYKDGITVCADCGAELVEASPEEIEVSSAGVLTDEESAEKFVKYLEYSGIKYARADYIEEKNHYDILVKDGQEEEASKLMKGFLLAQEEEEDERREAEAKKAKAKKQKKKNAETEKSEDAENSEISENIDNPFAQEESEKEYDWDAEDDGTGGEDETAESEDTEDSSEEAEEKGFVANAMYAKKSDEYKDLKFSGITFLFFGILGILYLVLCKIEVIGLTYSTPVFIVLVLMFVIFMGVGVHSLIKSGQVKELIGEEETLTKKVEEALASIMTQELVDAVRAEDATEEEKYITLTERVKASLAEQFGTEGLTENYIDQLIEEYYSENYEK